MKQFLDVMEPKREELKDAVLELYHSLFPGDIFITQNFFEVWISVGSSWLIRFPYDFESIEMMNVETQNN